MMHPLRYLWLVLFLIALTLIALGLSLYARPGSQTPNDTVAAHAEFPADAPPPRAQDRVEAQHGFDALVSFGAKGFQPSTISIKAGKTIRITNNSADSLLMRTSSPLPLPSVPITPRSYVEVTIPAPGSYQLQDSTTGSSVTISVQ